MRHARLLPWLIVLLISPLTVPAVPLSAASSAFYAAPDGRADGDGSRARPWDLATALAHPPAVRPGDTIWLRGGTYRGAFRSRLAGAAGAPVIVRQSPGERAILDGAGARDSVLTVTGAWAVYWGFELTSSDPDRNATNPGSHPADLTRGTVTGLTVLAPHTKFINLAIHDAGVGVGFWRAAADSELYGNLIFYNGWDGPDRGHGHGIYTQNEHGLKQIVDNVIFQQFGSGLHVYGSEATALNNYRIEGNVLFNNGAPSLRSGFFRNLLVGGNALAQNVEVVENFAYYPQGRGGENNLGEQAGVRNARIERNLLYGDTALEVSGSVLEGLNMRANLFAGRVKGFAPERFPENAYYRAGQRPSGVQIFVRPNRYEPGRGHVIVFNFDLAPRVSIDLSRVLTRGDAYEIRDVQDLFGPPVASGTFTGTAVSVPMNLTRLGSPVGAVGGPLWRHTAPEFAVFVIRKVEKPSTF